MKRVFLCVFALYLIVLPFFSILRNNFSKNIAINPQALVFGAIEIHSNSQWSLWATALGWSGNGNKNDPYIIEDEVFNGNSECCLQNG